MYKYNYLYGNFSKFVIIIQYLSIQVIKGLSYLREKHKIMHRGES